MAAVASLSLNGCSEIENLLAFCKIPKERVRIEESGHASSTKVWISLVFLGSCSMAENQNCPASAYKIRPVAKVVPLSCRT